MKQPPQSREQLVLDWHRRSRELQSAHYECAKPLERYNVLFGIPVIALSTLVGTSVFASVGKEASKEVQIVVGCISVLAGVLSALQTFLRFSERASKHR